MRQKILMPDEVIRFLFYGVLLSLLLNISVAYSQFDATPFAWNDDDVKEPNFSNAELIAANKDLQSIYDDTAQMLYNSTGDGTAADIHQVYPSQSQQNYTSWFSDLLNNTNSNGLTMKYNFSQLFPGVNTSKDSYYELPETFRVYPNDKNFTILNLKIPPNVSNVDASIFDDALNTSSSSDNDNEIYVNMPPMNSTSLNNTANLNFINQFFHTNSSSNSLPEGQLTSSPSTPNMPTLMMPPTAVLPKPTPSTIPMNSTLTTPPSTPIQSTNVNSSAPTVNDLLAKRIAEDETKNSSSYIDSMLYKLGLQQITLNGNPNEPMYVYRMNTTGVTAQNNSQPQNFTVPQKTFHFSYNKTNQPPLPSLQDNQTIVLPLPSPSPSPVVNSNGSISNASPPLANATAMPIPYLPNSPLAVNGSGQQDNLSYYGEPVSENSGSGIPRTPAIPKNVFISAAANDSVSDKYGEIVYTSVYFTSGSSTPPQPYPNDPYGNVTYWPEGINELTNAGKKELYNLGRWLNDRYKSLIGKKFNSSLISFDSGSSDIALTSAESLAAGLFPPRGQEIWNPLMLWQPIPVRSIPTDEDNMILMSKSCKQYDLQTKDLDNSPDWLQFYENNTETMNYISENTGANFTKNDLLNVLQTIYYYYEDLRIEEENNLVLPNWTSTVYPDKMMYFAEQYIENAVTNTNLQKIKTGPFFNAIIDNMRAKINSTNTSSEFTEVMHLYSGDAFGAGFLMKTLRIFDSIVPPNASALIFDLRYKDNDFVVTVSYKNDSSDVLYVLTVPHCNPICSFTQFINITNDLMMDDWDSYCDTISIFDLTYTIPIVIFGIAIIFILALVIILLVIKCCKNLRKKKASFG